MTRIFLGLGLVVAMGAGCTAPNLTNWRDDPTDRELAAMVNRHAAFDESPYGPYGAPTRAELERTAQAGRTARRDRDDVVFWMEADDPAWTGKPDARVLGQAQWLTAIEARVVGTQPWERGAAIVQHLRMDWMRDTERRATIARNLQAMARDRRFAYGGFAMGGRPPADSEAAEDGRPGLTVHERHAWRINWGYGHHWWMRDDRPPVVLNAMLPPARPGAAGNKPAEMPPAAGKGEGEAQPKKPAPKKKTSESEDYF